MKIKAAVSQMEFTLRNLKYDFVEKKKEVNKFIITIRLVGKAIIMMGKTN